MDDGQNPTFFPLTIKLDPEGTDWTHFFNRSDDHVLTMDELPEPLQELVEPIVEFLLEQRISRIGFIPDRYPLCHITLEGERDPHLRPFLLPEESFPTILLLAWWMEWSNRKTTGRGQWKCLECTDSITTQHGHCKNADCLSWLILPVITGRPILSLVTSKVTDAS